MMSHYQILCTDSRGTHQMSYHQWGEPDNSHVLLCVHGLTRNGRDFDDLAQSLMESYRIICPDLAGRGESDWLTESSEYGLPLYVSDLLTLCQQLSLTQVDWIGTSLGGLIGMQLASQKPSLIRRLVLNDVGALIPQQALQRIAQYLCQPVPELENFEAVVEYVRQVYQPFGDLTETQWQQIAQHTVKEEQPGRRRLHYDPKIASSFQETWVAHPKDADLGKVWESLACPILLLHGEESDLLSSDIITMMKASQPLMEVVHFPHCGHAPALMDSEQIDVVRNWLLSYSKL